MWSNSLFLEERRFLDVIDNEHLVENQDTELAKRLIIYGKNDGIPTETRDNGQNTDSKH